MEHRNSVLIVEDDVNINGLLKKHRKRRVYMYAGVLRYGSKNDFTGGKIFGYTS